MFTLKKSFIKF